MNRADKKRIQRWLIDDNYVQTLQINYVWWTQNGTKVIQRQTLLKRAKIAIYYINNSQKRMNILYNNHINLSSHCMRLVGGIHWPLLHVRAHHCQLVVVVSAVHMLFTHHNQLHITLTNGSFQACSLWGNGIYATAVVCVKQSPMWHTSIHSCCSKHN